MGGSPSKRDRGHPGGAQLLRTHGVHACMQLTKKWQHSKPVLETLAANLHSFAECSDPSRKNTSSGDTAGHGGDASPRKGIQRKSHAQMLKQANAAPAQRQPPALPTTAALAPTPAEQQELQKHAPGEATAEELQRLLEGIQEPARGMHAVLCATQQHRGPSERPDSHRPGGAPSSVALHGAGRTVAAGAALPFPTPPADAHTGTASPHNGPDTPCTAFPPSRATLFCCSIWLFSWGCFSNHLFSFSHHLKHIFFFLNSPLAWCHWCSTRPGGLGTSTVHVKASTNR